jgi:hypothetical protein
MEELEAAIDRQYGNPTFTGVKGLKMWRVEREEFAIQLSNADKRDEKLAKLVGDTEEVETKTVIYIAFQPPQKCSFP